MTGPKQKVETTWLQCTVSRAEWDAINTRRLALNLAWKDVIMPATLAYLDQLEASPPAPKQPVPSAKAGKTQSIK